MATSRQLSGRDDSDPAPPIYGSTTTQASERVNGDSRGVRILAGAIAGVAVSFLVDQLGLLHVFGFGDNSWLVALAVLGAALALTRFRLVFGFIALALLALTLVVSYTSVIVAPAIGFIRQDPAPAHADAVVALSAGVTPDGYLTQQGLDRILSAAALVRSGVGPVLVVTHEVRTSHGREFSSGGDQQRIALLASVPMVVAAGSVSSTHDEALAVARLAKAKGWQHVVLVTSPFHSRRACATFEKTGLSVSCMPGDSRDIAIHHLRFSHERLQAFQMWLYETAGTLRYRQLGWI